MRDQPSGFFNPWFQLALNVLGVLAYELLLKAGATAFRSRKIISILGAGIFSMTISFFLNLGLLQRFDLSYLYPFQGLSVIIISLMAAVILKEKLTMQLAIGSLLITVGVVLVSLS